MWLTDLKLFWVVLAAIPVASLDKADGAAKAAAQAEKAKWDEANQACLSRLLNVLSNRLFDVYSGFTSAKGLWAELENEFAEVDNVNESFTTENYLNYKMVEGRSVMEPLREIQLLVRDLVQYGCNLPDSFQVNAILAKLPPSWRDFVTARRHMKKQMTLSELSAAINVEERARASNKPSQQVQAHFVEKSGGKKNQKKKKNAPQQNQTQPKSKNMKKKKEDFICYVCGDSGHIARKCSQRKGKGPPPQRKEGNMVVNSTSVYAPLAFMAGMQQQASLNGKWSSGSSSRHRTALEAEWLRDLLSDLPMIAKPIPAVLVYCDNTSVLQKVNSRKDNLKSSRHIRRRLNSCRHARETGVITLDYIKSERNLADPLTKGLAQKSIQAACVGMGLIPY
ncbi:hypothetical protein U9M48_031252 [Paspalum notatum var. saurae]|uniref:CCHC-type domain-containing protein n=1 Tax=Paspalum notatum var. saurae TaxID=547442 RepID=A0AAQ3U721_PASNO